MENKQESSLSQSDMLNYIQRLNDKFNTELGYIQDEMVSRNIYLGAVIPDLIFNCILNMLFFLIDTQSMIYKRNPFELLNMLLAELHLKLADNINLKEENKIKSEYH